MEAFIHGVILAFGLILPLGVQNLFVFNQGATQPTLLRALPVVMTASVCDTLLILLAVQGITIFLLDFSWFTVLLTGVGCVFLLYMGWTTWRAPADPAAGQPVQAFSLRQQVTFAASVSLLNPHAIMDTIVVIGTSSLAYAGHDKWLFTVACILVSWFWFLHLACAGRVIGKRAMGAKGTAWLNKISAAFIWLSAAYMLNNIF